VLDKRTVFQTKPDEISLHDFEQHLMESHLQLELKESVALEELREREETEGDEQRL
jgi:hypothetical protein